MGPLVWSAAAASQTPRHGSDVKQLLEELDHFDIVEVLRCEQIL